MADTLLTQAAVISPPGAGTRSSVLAATASAVIDLNAMLDKWVVLKSTTKTHIQFAAVTGISVTTNDWYMTADVDYPFYITSQRRYFKHKGGGSTGNLHYVVMSDVLT